MDTPLNSKPNPEKEDKIHIVSAYIKSNGMHNIALVLQLHLQNIGYILKMGQKPLPFVPP